MQNKLIVLLSVILLAVANPVLVIAKTTMESSSGTGYSSVEWQAIKLQESIENKIKRSLRPIITEDNYVIEVKVGIDLDRAEDPTPKKKIKSVQKKKVQFSNVAFPKNGDDFVVFNKLGLEAPIVGEEPIESEVSEAELNQKATIELNDRYNLFNFLETVNISITFDKSVSEKARENIKAVLDGLSFYTKDTIPQYNIQYIDLKEKPAKEEDKKDEKKQAAAVAKEAAPKKPEVIKEQIIQERRPDLDAREDRFKNLDIMIGMIAGALVLGLTALYINHKGNKVEETVTSVNENNDTVESETEEEVVAENTDSVDEENTNAGEDMIDLTGNDAVTAKINLGLERFRTVMQHHKSDAILQMKEWIQSGGTQESEALKALVQVLSDGELTEIFKLLNIDERSSWKTMLDGEMTKEEIAKSFVFIGNELIKKMMVPSLIDDYEICDLLLSVSAEDASKYCVKYPSLGVVFANVLSAKVISEMFKMLPHDVAVNIIESSTVFKREEIMQQMPMLKELLIKAKESKERPPFLKRIIDILPTAKPDIERRLYTTLLTHLSVDEASSIALSVLPSEIVDRLPGETFKEVMGVMSQDDQVFYLACLNENSRERQLDRFAPTGSKIRDMLEMELEGLLGNDVQMKRLTGERKAEVMQNFLKAARNYLSKNAGAKKEVWPVTREWLESIKSEIDYQKKKAA